MTVAMNEYESLKDPDDQYGLDFSNKTAMWIAYERFVESQRPDALFRDPLAEHLMEPYGKRLSDAMSIGLTLTVFDPPPTPESPHSEPGDASAAAPTPPTPKLSDVGTNIGFGLEGHVMYTAARTKLINNQVDQCVTSMEQRHDAAAPQVVNLGAGFDTRQYWLESLRDARSYWEIDTESVQSHKRAVINALKDNMSGETLAAVVERPLCPTYSLSADLSKESVADVLLPPQSKYKQQEHGGFQTTIPTCWIAEGIIMYLQRDHVTKLMDDESTISAPGSLLILNFATNTPNGPSIDEIQEQLEEKKWKQRERLMYGEDGFNFDRYPPRKPANKLLGIAMFLKL